MSKHVLELAEAYKNRHRSSFAKNVTDSEIRRAVKKVARALQLVKPSKLELKRSA